MQVLYLVSVWMHIVSATLWLGGMGFLVLVVVPWMRKTPRADGAAMVADTGRRFRDLAWGCFAVLLATGTFNLWWRGVRLDDFTRTEFLGSTFGHAVAVKLALFVVVLGVSAVHDFKVGPRATTLMREAPGSTDAERARRRAGLLGRANALLALLLFAVAVVLVRGCQA